MTVTVVGSAEPDLDKYAAACYVKTVDATGHRRRYKVSLTNDVINGRTILAGKRIDEHDYERDTPDGPTSAVYDAAREWFDEQGFEVKR